MKWIDFGALSRWSVLSLVLVVHVQSGTAQEDTTGETEAAAQPTPAGIPSESSASPEMIATWIAQLDEDRYEVRERASRNLEQHGRTALDSLAAAADGPSPEAASRAVAILENLADTSRGTELKIAVLERLVDLENRSSVRRRANEELAAVWEEVSLPIALEMGGRLDPDSIDLNGRRGYGKFIIGPDWTGGDEGLVHVSRLSFLHTVSIRRAAVTPAGIEKLAGMPSLEHLELYGVGLSEQQNQHLRQQFRFTQLDVRRGAMLGVRGLNGTLAKVDGVEPGSAAADADLRAGDVITKVDNVEVQSFAELTMEIAKHDPGNTAVLQVRRGDNLIERTVVFGQWE